MKKVVPDPPIHPASKKAAWVSMAVACERSTDLPGLLLPGLADSHAAATYSLRDVGYRRGRGGLGS